MNPKEALVVLALVLSLPACSREAAPTASEVGGILHEGRGYAATCVPLSDHVVGRPLFRSRTGETVHEVLGLPTEQAVTALARDCPVGPEPTWVLFHTDEEKAGSALRLPEFQPYLDHAKAQKLKPRLQP